MGADPMYKFATASEYRETIDQETPGLVVVCIDDELRVVTQQEAEDLDDLAAMAEARKSGPARPIQEFLKELGI